MRVVHQRENQSHSSDRLQHPLELTDQTPFVLLDRRSGIIAEREGKNNGRTSSRSAINQHRLSHWGGGSMTTIKRVGRALFRLWRLNSLLKSKHNGVPQSL
jgi:hypothetical protein